MKTALKAFIVATLALVGCSMSATADNQEFAKFVGEVPQAVVTTFTVDGTKCIAITGSYKAAISCNWEKKQ